MGDLSGAGKGVRVSRTTKRPATRSPNGVAAARRLLTEVEVTEGLRLDSEDLRVLRACCSMRPPRNAGAIVAAMKARLEYSQRKPVVGVEHSGNVTYQLVDPYATPEPSGG
jgi:hypothetical protein